MSVYCIINQTMRLSDPTRKITLHEPLAYSNQRAHAFRVTVMAEDGETAADLTGVGCSAAFMHLKTEDTVSPIIGTVTNNVAEVVLPASCYVTTGRFTLTMDLSCPSSTDGVDAFSTSVSYAKDDRVVYENVVYYFTAAHSAGAWTGEDVVAEMENRTALWVEGVVEKNTTNTIIDPGTPVANYTTIIAEAEAAATAAVTAAASATAAAAAANNAVSYEAQSGHTDDEKAAARKNIWAASAGEGQLIPYDYEADFSGTFFTNGSNSVSMTRNGMLFTFDGVLPGSSNVSRIKLNGTPASATNATGSNNWGTPTKLVPGHRYRFSLRQVSGTITTRSSTRVHVYQSGASTNLDDITYTDGNNNYICEFDNLSTYTDGIQLVFGLSRSSSEGGSFDNWVAMATLEDITGGARTLPPPPSGNGTYLLKLTISNSGKKYEWVADS